MAEDFKPVQLPFRQMPNLVMSFGKHEGKPVSWLVKHHPRYAQWLLTLPSVQYRNLSLMASLRYHLAKEWSRHDMTEKSAELTAGGFYENLAKNAEEIRRLKEAKRTEAEIRAHRQNEMLFGDLA